MRSLSLGLLLIHAVYWPPVLRGAEPQNVPVDQLGKAYQLVGKLHMPLGAVIRVEGVVVKGPFKGYEGGPNLRAQRIEGQATQEDIQIPIYPHFTRWGNEGYAGGRTLPKPEMGKTYEIDGYETGGYIGIPAKAGPVMQASDYYFRTQLVVCNARRIEPLCFTPADFLGRAHSCRALLAREITSRSWRVTDGAWPSFRMPHGPNMWKEN